MKLDCSETGAPLSPGASLYRLIPRAKESRRSRSTAGPFNCAPRAYPLPALQQPRAAGADSLARNPTAIISASFNQTFSLPSPRPLSSGQTRRAGRRKIKKKERRKRRKGEAAAREKERERQRRGRRTARQLLVCVAQHPLVIMHFPRALGKSHSHTHTRGCRRSRGGFSGALV